MRAKGRGLCAMMLILGMALFAAAQGSQALSGSPPRMVDIEDFAFSPFSLTVAAGDRVEWTNLDDAPHTVSGGPLDSGTLLTGSTYDFTFTEPGEFAYACSFHPAMEGKVIVVENGAAVAPATDEVPFSGDEAFDVPFEEEPFNGAGVDAGAVELSDPALLRAEDAGMPAWAYAFMVFFGFALLAGIVLVVMLRRGKRVLPKVSALPQTGVPVEFMPALKYVCAARARGMTDAQVKASFAQQGWSDEQIEQVYRFL